MIFTKVRDNADSHNSAIIEIPKMATVRATL